MQAKSPGYYPPLKLVPVDGASPMDVKNDSPASMELFTRPMDEELPISKKAAKLFNTPPELFEETTFRRRGLLNKTISIADFQSKVVLSWF